MQIRDFDHTPADYGAVVHIMNTVWHELHTTVDDLRTDDEEYPAQLIHRRFVAEVDGQMVGFGSYSQSERFYHRQRFWVYLDVLPEWRQRGIGTQLYDHMLALLQTEYSSNELHADTTDSRDHSVRFLENRGFQEDKREPTSRLLVLDVPDPAPRTKVAFDSWRQGYSIENPYYLPEAHFVALHESAFIGLTGLWGNRSDEKLYVGMSGVRREYRRKGLVTALKLRSIAFVQAQGTRVLMTSNNSENPMLQINL